MTRAAQTLPLDNLDVGSRLGRQLSARKLSGYCGWTNAGLNVPWFNPDVRPPEKKSIIRNTKDAKTVRHVKQENVNFATDSFFLFHQAFVRSKIGFV